MLAPVRVSHLLPHNVRLNPLFLNTVNEGNNSKNISYVYKKVQKKKVQKVEIGCYVLPSMSVTLDTVHLERSLLNLGAKLNAVPSSKKDTNREDKVIKRKKKIKRYISKWMEKTIQKKEKELK